MQRLLRTKPVTAGGEADGHGLKRSLNSFDIVLLGIGAIIGAGIFVLTGHAAATQTGPAIVLSFVVAGIACAFAALSYAELAASVGGAGSAYAYSYAAFGEFIAWIIGWDLILEYGIATSAVATGWSGYFNNALTAVGLGLPPSLLSSPVEGGIVNLPAAAIILLLSLLLSLGVKESARVNNVMVFVKLVAIAIFLLVAIRHINPDNWSPFMPFGWFGTNPEGKPVGVMAGAAMVFFAYIGFDAVSTAVEETHNPQRNIPVGIVGSLVICTVIYIAVSALLTAVVPYQQLNVPSPVAHALSLLGYQWASGLVSAGAIAGLSTVMLVLYYALTRIIFAMSRDGLLPTLFTQVHPKTHTPIPVILITGVLMAILAGFIPLGKLAELVNIGTMAAFVLVCVGVIVLRVTHADLHRPFKVPLNPWLPLGGVLSCGALMLNLPLDSWIRFVVWLVVGVVIYLFYGIRHSKINA